MLHGMHFRVVEGEDMLDILEEFEGDGDSDSTSDDDDDEDEESLTRKGGVVNSSRAAVGKKAPPNKGREGNEGEAKVDGDNVDGDVDGRSLLGDDSGELMMLYYECSDSHCVVMSSLIGVCCLKWRGWTLLFRLLS